MSFYGRARLFAVVFILPILFACHKSSSSSDSSSSTVISYYVYTANGGTNDVSQFSMNPATGILTSIASNVPAHTNPINIAPGGGLFPFLYVLNAGSSDISGYSVNVATGALTSIAGSPFTTGAAGAESIAGTPGYMYVVNQSNNKIYGFSIDQNTGALAPLGVGPWNTGSSPQDIVVDILAAHLYTANGDGTIWGFSIDPSTGNLTPVAGSPFGAGTTPNGITIAGFLLFVADTGSNQIGVYSIDPMSGTLSGVAGQPFASGSSYVIGANPSAQFVYVQNGNNIEGHVVSNTGALSPMGGSPFSMGTTGPNGGFAFDTNLNYMYAHAADGKIYGYAVDHVTGALTALSTPSYATNGNAGGVRSIFLGELAQ